MYVFYCILPNNGTSKFFSDKDYLKEKSQYVLIIKSSSAHSAFAARSSTSFSRDSFVPSDSPSEKENNTNGVSYILRSSFVTLEAVDIFCNICCMY